MGSYCQTKISCDTVTNSVITDIVNYANSTNDFKSDPTFAEFCWNKFCGDSKWRGADLCTQLSRKFPTTIFREDVRGDYNYTQFYFNGNILSYDEVMPKMPQFPSKVLFKKRLPAALAKREAKRAAQLVVEKESQRSKLEAQLVMAEKAAQQAKAKLANLGA